MIVITSNIENHSGTCTISSYCCVVCAVGQKGTPSETKKNVLNIERTARRISVVGLFAVQGLLSRIGKLVNWQTIFEASNIQRRLPKSMYRDSAFLSRRTKATQKHPKSGK